MKFCLPYTLLRTPGGGWEGTRLDLGRPSHASQGRPICVVALKLRQARDLAFQIREEHVKRLQARKRLVYSKKEKETSVWNTGEMGEAR